MGDIQERLSVSSSSSSSSSSLSLSTAQPKGVSLPIDGDSWMIAEERAHEILFTIQPSLVSDRNRNEIIDYVRTQIKSHDGIEVFSFGSVPLKTYLPDGDIDLTVLTKQNMEDKFFEELYNTLKSEEGKSEFHVTDVQFIPAQVKVIKCNIRNIAVDISFNQMAGLCALCFLEEVDQLCGRDHLFKRSIILIKAWCYYESRILGANTGLISTYALAVLVLYIINLFHSSLPGPLAVLYKFLDYFSSFEWSNYYITVSGPVPISSLLELIGKDDAKTSPENEHDLLLDEKFLKDCVDIYSAPTKAVEANGLTFTIKHLNILDPLKHSNNLGKSVTPGNFRRVKNAFTRGARRLKDVLSLPVETMGWRLEKFFGNSLERNGKGQRQDVNDPVTAYGTGRSELSDLSGDLEGYFGRLVYGQMYHGYSLLGKRNYIPVTSQVKDPSDCDAATYQKNEFYLKGLNVSYSLQTFPLRSLTDGCQNMGKSRGTGTYIPVMNRQFYSDRFRDSSAGISSTDHSEAPTDAIDDDGANSCCNLSGEVSTSCAGIKGEICANTEACDNSYQPLLKSPRSRNLEIHENSQLSPPENLVNPISSGTLEIQNGKEENNRSSQTMNGS